MGGVSLIVKVASRCNLACSYCRYMPFAAERNKNHIMSRDVLHRAISQLMALSPNEARFIWHGGEPLLAGKEFFEEAISFQNQYRREGQKVSNRIQTNAVLLDQDWLDFIQYSGFQIGISLDGPKDIHDIHRRQPSQRGSFQNVMRATELLRTNKLRFGVLAVVTKESLSTPKRVFDFFENSGFSDFDFLPCAEVKKDSRELLPQSITPFEFADFMIEIFDLWIEYDNPEIRIRYFDNILIGLLGGKPDLCKFAGSCSNFLTIECNGDVYPCDHFIGSEDLKLGNILEADLPTLLNSEKHKNFVERVNTVRTECLKCKWRPLCKGGCSYYSYTSRGNFLDENYFCEARKRIFEHIEGRIEKIIDKAKARIAPALT